MNQILEFGTEKRGKAPKGHKGGGSASDKIVRVFAIILMIFAIGLIGSGVYSLLKNKDDSSNDVNVAETTPVNATINAVMDEANGTVILTVESEIAINKVEYNWNTNTGMTIDGQNQTTLEKTIELPSGDNTLNVKVTDTQGNVTSQSFDFESESGDDIISPNITLEVTEDKNLLITATDETEMYFLTYRWNDDEETTVYVDEDSDDKKTISVEIEIPEGTNTITVVAVDASSKYNTRTETKTLTGVKKPEITYEVSADGSEITFYCTHSSGIKEIYYTLNDQPYAVTYNEETGYPTEASFSQKWDEGYNLISLRVTSVDDTVGTFEGEYNYGNTSDSGNTSGEDSENTDNTTNTAGDTNSTNTTETNE